MNDAAIADILKNRYQGHRDSTYAMLMQLINQMPACLHALEQMVVVERIGCWRDVRGFIRHFERMKPNHPASGALIQGCVRMTNAQLRKDWHKGSFAAKWVPREPKCRGSPLLQWYYDALAADMFPGVPDAKRRYRKLISALSPPTTTTPMRPTLAWFVKQAANPNAKDINALWQQHLHRHRGTTLGPLVPVLSLAHSMGPGHNNCLHAGIGLALHIAALSQSASSAQTACRILTFSSHAEWYVLEGNDFVSHARHLLLRASSPLNGLNANLARAISETTLKSETTLERDRIIVISDMEHDDDPSLITWNVSRNGRPATFCGDKNL